MSRHRWYNTARWRKRRALLLSNEPLCRACRNVGRITVATVADHIVPHRGDEHLFWYGDLQPLCATCHNSMKARQESSGVEVGATEAGIPVDPNHHWNR